MSINDQVLELIFNESLGHPACDDCEQANHWTEPDPGDSGPINGLPPSLTTVFSCEALEPESCPEVKRVLEFILKEYF